jgi:hypothetical protein
LRQNLYKNFKLGGKCPLEMLQMTCAAIGRESPKPKEASKKRKLNPERAMTPIKMSPKARLTDSPNSSKMEINVKRVEKPEEQKHLKSPKPVRSPDLKAEKLRQSIIYRKSVSPRISKLDAEVSSPQNTANLHEKLKLQNRSLSSHNLHSQFSPLMSSSTPFQQSTDLERYLRATASLYGTHIPQTSLYPSLPGIMPALSYMNYFTPTYAHNLVANFSNLAAYSSNLNMSGIIPENVPENTGVIHRHDCNWGKCGKSFTTVDSLAHHVKLEHLKSSRERAEQPEKIKSQGSIPRFTPYSLPTYPRDLLSPRFIHS